MCFLFLIMLKCVPNSIIKHIPAKAKQKIRMSIMPHAKILLCHHK